MKALLLMAAVALGSSSAALAQASNPIPVPLEEGKRVISSPEVYRREGVWKKKAEALDQRRADAEQELAHLKAQLGQPDKVPPTTALAGAAAARTAATGGLTAAPVTGTGACPPTTPPARRSSHPKRQAQRQQAAARAATTPVTTTSIMNVNAAGAGFDRPQAMPLVFAVSGGGDEGPAGETAVPLGSYVKARVLTGVEANTQEAFPILLQLDYAFVGPNKTKIDLSNCFVIAKAKANLSTERVMGETQQLSCVRANNEVVTRPAKGYLAGEDSTFGVAGELISNQGRVLLAAVIASLAKSAGEAVAAAQTTTQIATGGIGGTAQATNITGNQAAYVAGRAVTEPATLIAQWYLDHAKSLVPSIAVGSGRDVWIVLLETVRVPEVN